MEPRPLVDVLDASATALQLELRSKPSLQGVSLGRAADQEVDLLVRKGPDTAPAAAEDVHLCGIEISGSGGIHSSAEGEICVRGTLRTGAGDIGGAARTVRRGAQPVSMTRRKTIKRLLKLRRSALAY